MRRTISLVALTFLVGCAAGEELPIGDTDSNNANNVNNQNNLNNVNNVNNQNNLNNVNNVNNSNNANNSNNVNNTNNTNNVQEPPGPSRYNPNLLLSPITRNVVETMDAIQSVNGPDDTVFMKVGASGTVNNNFLDCFAGQNIDLAGDNGLQATINYFNATSVPGGTSWDRDTQAAVVGRTASWAIGGSPSPIDQEAQALNPRFALVNYGTNDMQMGSTHQTALWPFWDNMWQLLTGLMADGIVPIVTGLNPRGDATIAAQWVPTYNEVTRAMAQALQLPYIDLYNSVVDLPSRGLVGDGLHGNAAPGGACLFNTPNLQYNYNVRNLETLQMLDRVRRTVVDGEAAPDVSLQGWTGTGSLQDPIIVDQIPFSHSASTTNGPSDVIDAYPACDSGQDESGPEVFYRLDLNATTRLRIMVFDAAADIDVHHLDGSPSADNCRARNDKVVQGTFAAGTHYFAFDTYVSPNNGPQPGDFTMVIVECEAGDSTCN